jgi:hypothetical protein
MATPDASRRSVHPPRPPAWAAHRLHHSQILRLSAPALPQSACTPQASPGRLSLRRPCTCPWDTPGIPSTPTCAGAGTARQERRGATRPRVSSIGHHESPALMTIHRSNPLGQRPRQGVLDPAGTARQKTSGLRLTTPSMAGSCTDPHIATALLQAALPLQMWPRSCPLPPACRAVPSSPAQPPTP